MTTHTLQRHNYTLAFLPNRHGRRMKYYGRALRVRTSKRRMKRFIRSLIQQKHARNS